MKKLLLATFIVFCLFLLKSVSANQVLAVDPAPISVILDNRSGGINVGVTLNFSGQTGSNISPSSPFTRTAYKYVVGSTSGLTTVVASDLAGAHAPYYLTWTNDCGDSGALTVSALDPSGFYTFSPSPDVHCTGTNSSVTITDTSCPLNAGVNTGHVGWVVGNVANANIANFKVYYAAVPNNADSGSFVTSNFVAGTSAYTADIGALNNGNWNVEVIAYPTNYSPNGDDGISTFKGSFTCGAGVSSASNLSATTSCPSTTPTVSFTWSPATPGTFNYTVETSTATTDPGPYGSWTGTTFTPSPATANFVSTTTLVSGTYWWHVKAVGGSPSGTYFSSSAAQLTVPSCAAGGYVAVSNLTAVTCASNSDNNDFDTPIPAYRDAYANANPNKVKFVWTRATPSGSILQEFLDYSTSSSFSTGVTSVPNSLVTSFNATSTTQAMVIVTPATTTVDTQYFYRVRTKMSNNQWYVSPISQFKMPGKCFDPLQSSEVVISGYSYCAFGHNQIRFRVIVKNSTKILPGLDVVDPFTQFNWKYSSSSDGSNGSFVGSTYGLSMATDGATGAPGGKWWYVDAVWNNQTGSHNISNIIQIADASCDAAPSAVDTLTTLQAVCTNPPVPSVVFKFKDRSSNETGFELNVSSERFTGDYSTDSHDSWGVKSLGSSSGTGGDVSFTWNSSSPLGSGDANVSDLTPGNNLMPLDGATYYWRVRAIGSDSWNGASSYVYPDGSFGTTTRSGALLSFFPCKPRYDMQISFGSLTDTSGRPTTNFAPNTTARIQVRVANVSVNTGGVPISTSWPTEFYFYPHGGASPDPPMPNCTATGFIDNAIPKDNNGAGDPKNYTVVSMEAGSSQTITVDFNVGSTAGIPIAQAYIVPKCAFVGDTSGALEYDWISPGHENKTPSGQSYKVNSNTFFASTGGDVGATRKLSVGVDSTDVGRIAGATQYWQSDYLAAGGVIEGPVSSKKDPDWKLSRYDPSLALFSDGVYSYIKDKFKSKAVTDICNNGTRTIANGASSYNFAATPAYYYCSGIGASTISSSITFTGTGVIFIDGDLEIKGNVTASGAADGVVFVVSGDIAVSSSPVVNRIDGIYIAGNSFSDTNLGGGNAVVASTADALTVNGAVYADGVKEKVRGRAFSLARSFDTVDNNTKFPSDIFNFDPKYFVLLQTLLSSSDVGWKEVAP